VIWREFVSSVATAVVVVVVLVSGDSLAGAS